MFPASEALRLRFATIEKENPQALRKTRLREHLLVGEQAADNIAGS